MLPSLLAHDIQTALKQFLVSAFEPADAFNYGLMSRFVDEGRGFVSKLSLALGQGDLETARRQAHTFKGLAGTFAMTQLQRAAIELEQKVISDAIISSAKDVGFIVEAQTVEVVGLCAGCQGA